MTPAITARDVPALDGLRVLAALGVIAIHSEADARAANLTFLLTGAAAGPLFAVFFGISGFVLYRGWAARHLAGQVPAGPGAAAGGADGRFRAYAARRALRIYPVYWVVATVMLRVEPSRTGRSPIDLAQVYLLLPVPRPAALLEVGLGLVVWTLVLDVAFYAYVAGHGAAVEAVIRSRCTDRATGRGAVAPRVEAAGLAGLGMLCLAAGPLSGLPFTVLGSLPLGMALAVLDTRQRSEGRRHPLVGAALAHWPVVVGSYLLLIPIGVHLLLAAPDALTAFLHNTLVNVVMAAYTTWFLAAVLWGPPSWLLHRVLTGAALRRAAVLTYGTYLWHPVVLRVLAHRSPRPGTAATLAVTLTASICLAAATHLAIERPLSEVRRRLGARTAPTPAAHR